MKGQRAGLVVCCWASRASSQARLRRAASTHAVKCGRGRLSSCDNTAGAAQRRWWEARWMMYLAVNEMGLRVSPSECRLQPDRLSSCLNLMACVITRARLDSIAVVVPESVHNHRDAIPQKPKAPAYDLLFRVCTAAPIHLLGRSARKHRASRQPAARWSTGISSSYHPAHHLLCVRF